MPERPKTWLGRYWNELISSSLFLGSYGLGPFGLGPTPSPLALTHTSRRRGGVASTAVGYEPVGTRPTSWNAGGEPPRGTLALRLLRLLLGLLAEHLGGLLLVRLGQVHAAPALAGEDRLGAPGRRRALRPPCACASRRCGRSGRSSSGRANTAMASSPELADIRKQPSGRHRDVHRGGADALRPLDRQRALDRHVRGVDHRDQVLVRHGHVGPRACAGPRRCPRGARDAGRRRCPSPCAPPRRSITDTVPSLSFETKPRLPAIAAP